MKHFTFHKETWTLSETHHLKRAVITIDDELFKKFMCRFGKYLTSIDLDCEFSAIQHQLTLKSIQHICQFCKKLQALNLSKLLHSIPTCKGKIFDVSECECETRILKIIMHLENWENISTLKKFGVDVVHFRAKYLSRLISKMKSLESLFMELENYHTRSSYLSELPFNNLREIVFEGCDAIEERDLIQVSRNKIIFKKYLEKYKGTFTPSVSYVENKFFTLEKER